MARELQKDIRLTKSHKKAIFSNITFDGLEILSSKIIDSKFSNIYFKHSRLSSGTKYINCIFDKCKIEGKYATLGHRSTFRNCTFLDCNFIGRMIFMGAIFIDCKFSGVFKNNIFIDEKRLFKKLYTFEDCDLSHVKFNNSTFNGTRTFKNCILPEISAANNV
jgi:uncharacterized protein YjbI with pentapeptide repeats